MTRVFIGGSRKISRLNADVRRRLDQIVDRELSVLVGDANGADKAVQQYLHERGYQNVTVFCTGGRCRNNVGGWRVESVVPPHKARDFAFFAAKDAAMTQAAEAGLMLWDGQSAGTVVNVARLLAAGKIAVVYHSPERRFLTLRTPSDFEQLLAVCSAGVRPRLEQYVAEHVSDTAQSSLFDRAS